MTTGVIDNLELVQIQITEGVFSLLGLCRLQGPLQSALEFVAIDQAREDVVGGLNS